MADPDGAALGHAGPRIRSAPHPGAIYSEPRRVPTDGSYGVPSGGLDESAPSHRPARVRRWCVAPHIVRGYPIRDRRIGPQSNSDHRRAHRDQRVVPRTRRPDLHRERQVAHRSVGQLETELHRERHRRVPHQAHGRARPATRVDRVRGIHADVEHITRVEERAPEPREVLPAHVLHRPKEIAGCGVLECPAPRVLTDRLVEGRTSHHMVAQREQRRGGLRVEHRADRPLLYLVGRRHQRGLRAVGHHLAPLGHRITPLGGVGTVRFERERVDIGVQPFVHPAVAAFVRPHQHREPLVALLVVQRAEHRAAVTR